VNSKVFNRETIVLVLIALAAALTVAVMMLFIVADSGDVYLPGPTPPPSLANADA
jgi:hypothetical protein